MLANDGIVVNANYVKNFQAAFAMMMAPITVSLLWHPLE